MRNKILNSQKMARWLGPVALAALGALAGGCGSDATGGTITIPDCKGANRALSTDKNGQLICKDLPAGAYILPKCLPDVEALTSDGKGLTCTNRRVADAALTKAQTDLTFVEDKLNDYGTRIKTLLTKPGAVATYVGVTQNTVNGKIAKAGKDVGIASAAAYCNDAFTGSHMCTVNEMYYSFAYEVLKKGKTVPKSWIYFPAWNTPLAGAMTPLEGQGDNCGQYTTADPALNWSGSAVEYNATNLSSGQLGMRFHGGPNAACDQLLPIACCR